MKTTNYMRANSLIGAAVAAALLVGCSAAPVKPAGAAQVRAKFTALQADPALAGRAAAALKDAEVALNTAEMKEADPAIGAHRVYIADRKVDTARALAEMALAEQERTALTEQGEKARLNARTREADRAKSDAATARADSAEQKLAANQARGDADAAMLAANTSHAQAAELQRQLEILQARPTDRGLVLTLGDTLFATGKAELRSGATANLDKLTAFMNEYPTRTAAIEGFTDSMGSDEYNRDLSQRRAEAVKRYMVGQGVQGMRLNAEGKGETMPVADNESAAGRQQNRRVEVIISPATD